MIRGLRVIGVALAASLFCVDARGDDANATRFAPATFGAGPNSLLGTISCPKPPEPDAPVVVLCQAQIESDGQTQDGSSDCVFRGHGQRCAIAAIANLGGETDGDDLGYIAPQEIISERSWFWRATRLQGPGGSGYIARPAGAVLTLSVAVSTTGVASNGRVENDLGVTRTEAHAAVRALEQSRFIPGFRARAASPMRYVERLYVLD